MIGNVISGVVYVTGYRLLALVQPTIPDLPTALPLLSSLLLRCDPDAFLDLTSSCPLPTLHCMLHTVLPSFVSRSQSSGTDNTSADGGRSLRETRGASAVRALCRKAGILSASQKQDPVRFRDVLSASGLRNLGRLGREAEITLAEAFFEASHQA